MTRWTEQVYSEILELPVEERVQLIDKLLFDLAPVSDELSQAWLQESEERLQKYRSSQTKSLNGNQVFDALLRKYRS